jgi:carbonyl reductase 1
MDKNMTIVVTGSNRGLSQAISRLLAQSSHDPPLTIYATSRESVSLDIRPIHNNLIHFEQLDITSTSSIQSLISKINSPVDILINNAAVALDQEYNYENAVKTFKVNYRATRNICELFLNAGGMAKNKGSRIVNVTASGSSKLSSYSKDIQAQFSSPSLTLAGLDNLADNYLQSVKAGTEEKSGWDHVKGSYNVSKSCVNALTTVLSRQYPSILINCCCPGWNKTDMGRLGGDFGKDPMEGAKIPVKLEIGDIGDASGGYWANDGILDTGNGKLREW